MKTTEKKQNFSFPTTQHKKAVAEDPTVKDGIASIGCIPGWHDLEESKEIHDKEYAQFVDIAKSLGVCEVE